MKKISHKEYQLDDMSLRPILGKSEILRDFRLKFVEHHNSHDEFCPVTNLQEIAEQIDFGGNALDYWLIYSTGKVVGYLSFCYPNDEELEIYEMFIDDTCRNQGIGTRVLKFIKKLGYENGYTRLCAKVFGCNPSRNFYKRNGFKTYYRLMLADVND